jgi:hypothetical protein
MSTAFTTSFLALMAFGMFYMMMMSTMENERWFTKLYLVMTILFSAATALNGRIT